MFSLSSVLLFYLAGLVILLLDDVGSTSRQHPRD